MDSTAAKDLPRHTTKDLAKQQGALRLRKKFRRSPIAIGFDKIRTATHLQRGI